LLRPQDEVEDFFLAEDSTILELASVLLTIVSGPSHTDLIDKTPELRRLDHAMSRMSLCLPIHLMLSFTAGLSSNFLEAPLGSSKFLNPIFTRA